MAFRISVQSQLSSLLSSQTRHGMDIDRAMGRMPEIGRPGYNFRDPQCLWTKPFLRLHARGPGGALRLARFASRISADSRTAADAFFTHSQANSALTFF